MALEEQPDVTGYRELLADGLVTVGTGYAALAIFAAVGSVGSALRLARRIVSRDDESPARTDAKRPSDRRHAAGAARLRTVGV